MKLVFLDFDGVLNSRDWLYASEQQRNEVHFLGNEHLMLNREMVGRVNRILAASGAKVVISSSWRCGFDVERLREILALAGFVGDVIGSTPDRLGNGNVRGDEIQAWLDKNGGEGQRAPNFGWPSPFCILDDDCDMGLLLPRLVRTSWAEGLQDHHVEETLRHLL